MDKGTKLRQVYVGDIFRRALSSASSVIYLIINASYMCFIEENVDGRGMDLGMKSGGWDSVC